MEIQTGKVNQTNVNHFDMSKILGLKYQTPYDDVNARANWLSLTKKPNVYCLSKKDLRSDNWLEEKLTGIVIDLKVTEKKARKTHPPEEI